MSTGFWTFLDLGSGEKGGGQTADITKHLFAHEASYTSQLISGIILFLLSGEETGLRRC